MSPVPTVLPRRLEIVLLLLENLRDGCELHSGDDILNSLRDAKEVGVPHSIKIGGCNNVHSV